jgi:hypothetical protein
VLLGPVRKRRLCVLTQQFVQIVITANDRRDATEVGRIISSLSAPNSMSHPKNLDTRLAPRRLAHRSAVERVLPQLLPHAKASMSNVETIWREHTNVVPQASGRRGTVYGDIG